MKRLFALSLGVMLTVAVFLPTYLVSAGGGFPPVELSASASSTTANGTSKITFTAFVYYTMCSDDTITSELTCSGGATVVGKQPVKNAPINVYVTSGSDVVLSGTSFTTDTSGKASFTAASTTAGSKVITASQFNATHPTAASKTVTFTAPAPAPSAPKPTTTSSSTPVATAQAVAAPATPASTGFEVNGQTVASSEKPTVEQNKPFVLKGTTVPNGIVKLYIFSTPREATVTADSSGNWSYEVKDLEPGSHHVEAEVTDPKTQKTSERKTLAEFTVATAPTATTAPATLSAKRASNMKPFAWATLAVVVVLLGGAVWWFIRHKRAHDAAQNETTMADASDDINAAPSTIKPASESTPSMEGEASSTPSDSSDEPPKSS